MKISILGTGHMGSAIAQAVMKAGHHAIVYNRTPSKTIPLVALGAMVVSTPAEAIRDADATIIVLLDGNGLLEVLNSQETRKALQGKRLLNASTTNLSEILGAAKIVRDSGGRLAEMMIGTAVDGVRELKGSYMFGSDPEDLSFWQETLLSFGESAYPVGSVGDATKAETPLLLASMFNAVTTAYAVAAAQKLNVPREVFEPMIKGSIAGAEYIMSNMLNRNYDEIFGATDSYIAGLSISINTLKLVGIPTEVPEKMLALFNEAASKGFSKKDGASVYEALI